MHIVSKEHDYYDSVQAFGADYSITYVREVMEFPKGHGTPVQKEALKAVFSLVELLPEDKRFCVSYECDVSVRFFIVGFCGEYYAGIRVIQEGEEDLVFYDADTFRTYANTKAHRDLKESFHKKKPKYSFSGKVMFAGNDADIEKMFDTVNKYNNAEPFLVTRAPIFVVHQNPYMSVSSFIANAVLKEYKFSKVKDPFTAYQDIEMYQTGVLGSPSPQQRPISDIVKRDKKGFDKWSFKTMPGTKKPRRKNKK